MFKNHLKAILYRNTLVLKDSFFFLIFLIMLLMLCKVYIGISPEMTFFISVFFLIYIFQRTIILNFIEDKIMKFRMMFKIMGMSDKNYIFSQIISNIFFMSVFIILGTSIFIMYRKFEIDKNQIIFMLISILFSFSLINFNLFISLFFRNPILATDLSNMITFIINMITIILIFLNSKYVLIMKIIPNTCYYIIIKEYALEKEPSFTNIQYDVILLVFHTFFYIGLYYYFDTLLKDDNGMNKSVTEIFSLIKKRFEDEKIEEKENTNEEGVEEEGEDLLVLKNVSKKFENFELSDFSYSFKKNKFYSIIGANGAGKSTLLNVASGLFERNNGEVYFLGELVKSDSFPQKIGFCAAENILMDHLTVYQHLKLFSMVKNLINPEEKIENILNLFQIDKYRDFLPGQLSGGNKRKVCISLSYLGNPKLILLDEPSSSLDPFSKKDIFNLLIKLQKKTKCTVIMTSHNFDEIEVFPENIIMLNQGKVLVSGHLNEIKKYFEVGFELKLIPKKTTQISPEIRKELIELLSEIPNIKIFRNLHDLSIFVKNTKKSEILKIYKKINKKYSTSYKIQISTNLLENAIRHEKIKKNLTESIYKSKTASNIIKNMQSSFTTSKSIRIKKMIKMRIKFLFENSVQLATFILVNVFLLMLVFYNFFFLEKAYPNLSLNGCMLGLAFNFVLTEGYNNINYAYFIVYEKCHSIKKLLFCNGVSVHEYYVSRLIADLIVNSFLYLVFLVTAFFSIKWKIENSLFNDYQVVLLLIAIFLWKISFIFGNYLLSFVFLKTNYVTKNFFVIYFVISGIFFLLSSFFPYTYYLSDFCFMFEIAADFENIEKNVWKIFTAPIFQIILYYCLIIYIENSRLFRNYTLNENDKKENNNDNVDMMSVRSKKFLNLSCNQELNNKDYSFEVKDLKKVYKNRKISLDKISFKLNSGTCFGLIGPNGAGKSTFFNILISEIQKSTGQINFNQKSKKTLPFKKFNFAVSLQKNSLYTEFTVSYHFDLYSTILGIKKKNIVEDLQNFFDLKKFQNHKIFELTEGAKRRLCLALSLMRRPDYILYDEATTGIDIFTCHRIQKLIKKIEYEFGSIMILTTHLLREVDYLCDKMGILFEGRFVEFGNVNEIKIEKTKRILKVYPRSGFDLDAFFAEVCGIVRVKRDRGGVYGFLVFEVLDQGVGWFYTLLEFFERKVQERVIWDYEIIRTSLEDLFIDVVRNQQNKKFEIKV